jgi:hypothetical protein
MAIYSAFANANSGDMGTVNNYSQALGNGFNGTTGIDLWPNVQQTSHYTNK